MKIQFVLFALVLALPLSLHAHDHIQAGYLDSNGNGIPDIGEPLRFLTPPSATVPFQMLSVTSGRYAGFYLFDEYAVGGFSFTALSDGQAAAANPAHAATGSYIFLEITSVTGPAGGSFGFWDSEWSFSNSTPTESFLANESTGGFKFNLSDPIYPFDPTEDPFGHLHDRGWTVDLPGTYTVTFTLYDLGTSGPGGTAFHSPSETYTIQFQAVPEPGAIGLCLIGGAVVALARLRHRRRE